MQNQRTYVRWSVASLSLPTRGHALLSKTGFSLRSPVNLTSSRSDTANNTPNARKHADRPPDNSETHNMEDSKASNTDNTSDTPAHSNKDGQLAHQQFADRSRRDAAEPADQSVSLHFCRIRTEATGHQCTVAVAQQILPTPTLPSITGITNFLISLDSPLKIGLLGNKSSAYSKLLWMQIY
jgi:hypothetical protein